MRLVNVNTLKFEEFFEQSIPLYTILSHRWGAEELTYKEVAKDRIDKTKRGYKKLLGACRTASSYGLDYLWIDTCCIDKTSSAELSEAINSMFKWYQEAHVCLAYLEDVESDSVGSFHQSVWFTRSWTLQELLAPGDLEFFDSAWTPIGSKRTKAGLISTITGIPQDVLEWRISLENCLIGVKMSWASKRVATRPEDVAYSLMGIFGVNMPPLYGEGEKAFSRLLEEIIRHNIDPSFLSWIPVKSESNRFSTGRLLAKSPAEFSQTFFREHNLFKYSYTAPVPFGLTNTSLEMETLLMRWQPDMYAVPLAERGGFQRVLLIRQHTHHDGVRADAWYKVGVSDCFMNPGEEFLVRKRNVRILREEKYFPKYAGKNFGFAIRSLNGTGKRVVLAPKDQHSSHSSYDMVMQQDRSMECIFKDPKKPTIVKMRCAVEDSEAFFVDLSFDFDCRPCALIHRPEDMHSILEISDSIQERDRTGFKWGVVHSVFHEIDGGWDSPEYFIRPSSLEDISGELPRQFCPRASHMRVTLRHERHTENLEYWVFEISTKDRP